MEYTKSVASNGICSTFNFEEGARGSQVDEQEKPSTGETVGQCGVCRQAITVVTSHKLNYSYRHSYAVCRLWQYGARALRVVGTGVPLTRPLGVMQVWASHGLHGHGPPCRVPQLELSHRLSANETGELRCYCGPRPRCPLRYLTSSARAAGA